ncbi:uncharacterized protein K444DRAFT_201548 [Hyaloscypha bicolor E]|uniref:Uncharacterized protein n=1 Tax=Hyaloscypha bicolor E TaxID=1095630 RepID=A0A2J6SQV3_9HELO|nr:uncharacterized protein K444DRAFT_201548 [Hyaloscypha bicolor E]PMD53158.1 hypothetical protein K444DRAFT_201548 [Hyaloscypha bicolor E]
MGGSNIRHTIMPRFTPLKARNRGSIANSGSRKHLIFPNSGILTKFQCGVTKGPTRNYSRGGIVRYIPSSSMLRHDYRILDSSSMPNLG